MTGTDAGLVQTYLGVYGQVDIGRRTRGTEEAKEGDEVIAEMEKEEEERKDN